MHLLLILVAEKMKAVVITLLSSQATIFYEEGFSCKTNVLTNKEIRKKIKRMCIMSGNKDFPNKYFVLKKGPY